MATRNELNTLVNFRLTDRFTIEEALTLDEVIGYAMVLLEADQRKGKPDYDKYTAKVMETICDKLERICARETRKRAGSLQKASLGDMQ